MLDVSFTPATENDADFLAEIRARTMRKSLEQVGRFDKVRVRTRFLDTFDVSWTWKIETKGETKGETIGFFVLSEQSDHLDLGHLYISKPFQRLGVGQAVVKFAKTKAKEQRLPIRLCALVESPANEFYLKCGFHQTHSTALDNFYEYDPLTKNP